MLAWRVGAVALLAWLCCLAAGVGMNLEHRPEEEEHTQLG